MKKEYLVNNFDLIRLFGACQVMLSNHYIWHFELFVPEFVRSFFGWFSGVPIFFFLAGLFIPMSFCKNPKTMQFLQNRILKIFPVMWISIFLGVILMFISGFYPETSIFSFFKWLIIYLLYPLYTPEWLRGYGVGAINGALWVIPAQITFYLFVPCFYLYFKLNHRKGLWVLMTFFVLLAFKCIFGSFIENSSILYKVFSSSFFVQFPMFIFGMIVFENLDFFYKLVKGRFWIFFIIHCILGGVFKYFDIPVSSLAGMDIPILNYIFMISLGLCVLSAGYSYPTLSDKILHRKDISYGLYVYHMPIANFFLQTYGVGWFSAILSTIITFIISIFSYKFIEIKFLSMKKSSLRKVAKSLSLREIRYATY